MTRTPWRLVLFDAPVLLSAGGVSIGLSSKDAALLGLVALDGPLPSARAASLLWPGSGARGAMNNLHQRLHRLRKSTSARLLEVADSVALADDLRAEPVPDRAALEADPEAWDGQLLRGVALDEAEEFSTWLAAERRAWAGRRREAWSAIASDCERAGELVRALRYAQRLLADDPTSEHAHRRLMRLHYRRGDTGAAVSAFEACERTLKDELGLRPSAETIELLATIERATLAVPRGPKPLPASLMRPPRAVGRERERSQLIDANRDGQIAVLVGEAGMGKTRLLQDFVAAHPLSVYVQARPGDVAVPYGALARLLRAVVAATPSALEPTARRELVRVVPEFGDAAGTAPPGQVTRLQGAIEQLLASAIRRGALTLVVDDLHFADRASIEMLRTLLDAEALGELRWAFAHRPIAAADEDGALLQSLADSPRARWIVLSPLSDADLVELLEGLALPDIDAASFAPVLARHTGGNPLYVLETLRAARAPSAGGAAGAMLPRPEAIAHLIDRRLQRLSRPALALARVAAIAVPDFSIELAEQVLGTPAIALADAWRELEAADMLRGEAFAHDLVHDAVLRATPGPIAAHAHRQVAAFLAQRGAEPARVAQHWLAGGVGLEAAKAFRAAAARASTAGRAREQAALLEQAAAAYTLGGDADAALRVGVEAVDALLQSQGSDAALAFIDRLLAGPLTEAQAAHVWTARAMALMFNGRYAEAKPAARHALEIAAADDNAVHVGATRMLAHATARTGDVAGALASMQAMSPRAEAVPDLGVRVNFFGDFSNLLLQADRPVQALAAIMRHRALAQEAGFVAEQVTASMNEFALRLRRGDAALALEMAQQAARLLAAQPGQASMLEAWNTSNLGMLLCGCGRFAEGLAALQTARSAMAAQGQDLQVSVNARYTAEAMLMLGQTARAHALIVSEEGLTGRFLASRLVTLAQVVRAMRRDDEPLWRRAAALVSGETTHYDRIQVELGLLPFEADPERALVAAVALQQQAAECEYFPLALSSAAHRLERLRGLARWDQVARLVDSVESDARRLAGPGAYLPQLLHACAQAYLAVGQGADADRCLADALQWIHGVALPNVPPEFQDSFMNRNETNRLVRAAVARRSTAAG